FSDQRDYRFTPQGNGRYTGYVTSKKVGSDVIGFTTDQGQAAGKTAIVEYFTGDVDLTVSTISATPKEILANGEAISTVIVQLKDSNGNNFTSGTNSETATPYTVVLRSNSTSPIGVISPASGEMVNVGDGTFTAEVKSTQLGVENFGFTVDTLPGSMTETISYTNGNGTFDQGKSSITTNPKEIAADGRATSLVTVTLVHDGTDQPLTGLDSNQLTIITVDGSEMLGNLGSMSEVLGTGIYTFTMTSTDQLGTDNLTFVTAAGQFNGNDTIRYSAGDGNFDQASSSITADPVEIAADGVMTSIVTVTMYYDAAGQKPIIGYEGLELVTEAGAVVGIVGVPTDHQDGRYTFEVKSEVAGADTFHFQTRAYASVDTAQIRYTGGDGFFDQASSSIAADPVEIAADGVMTSIVTVTMYYDAAGQKPIIGYEGLELVTEAGAVVGIVGVPTDHQDGRYTFEVKSEVAGADTFHFQTRAYASVDTAQIRYTGGDGFFDQASSSITADPVEIAADGVMTSIVTVTMYYDAAGQKPIIGYEGLELVTEAGTVVGIVGVPTDHQDGRYTFEVKSEVAGADTFHFQTRAYASVDTAQIRYTGGDGFFDQASSSITADPVEIAADGVMTSIVTVTMYYDAAGQKPIIGYEGLELVTEAGTVVGIVGVPTDHQDGRYTFEVKSEVAGADTFHFQTRAYASDDTAQIRYTGGDGFFDQASSSITADPVEIAADGVMTSIVTVTMYYDAAGQKPIIGYEGLELVTEAGTVVGIMGVPTDHQDGRYTFEVKSEVVGADTFHFQTRAYASVDTAQIRYTGGDGFFDQASSSITADPVEIAADGVMTSIVTVTMYYDAAGQKPIIGYEGLELVTEAGAVVGIVGVPTDHQDGRYTFEVKSEVAGADTFHFQTRAYASVDTAQIRYTGGDGFFDQASSSITADPVEIAADGVMTSIVTVTMYYDAAGQKPIIGYEGLELVTEAGTVVGIVGVPTDHQDGRYTFEVKSEVAGADTFHFQTRAYASVDTAQIRYTGGDGFFDQASSSITADP
ncbi:Ig-like domain-containing protein, partial [Ignatzschineria sp. LJL83]